MLTSLKSSKYGIMIEEFEFFREKNDSSRFFNPMDFTLGQDIAYRGITKHLGLPTFKSSLTYTEAPIDYIKEKLSAGFKTNTLEAYCAYQLLLVATRLNQQKTTTLNLNSFFHAIMSINEFDLEAQEIIQQKITETGEHGTGKIWFENDFSKKIITPIRNSGIQLEGKELMLENQKLIEKYVIYATINETSSLPPSAASTINFNEIFNKIAETNRSNKENLKIFRNILSSKAEDISFPNTSRNFGNQVKFPLSTRYGITELSEEEGPEGKSESRELCTFSEFKKQAHLLLKQAYSQLVQKAVGIIVCKKEQSKMLTHFERIEHYIQYLEPEREDATYLAEPEAQEPVNEIGPEAKSEIHEITCLFIQQKVSSCINKETAGLFASQDPFERRREL